MHNNDGSDAGQPQPQALERLSQVASHVAANKPPQAGKVSRSRRSRSSTAGPPADYSDILANLDKLRTIANTPDLTNRGYIRQKSEGKLWVRERLEKLLDPSSFKEIGSASGRTTWKQISEREEEPVAFTPTNNLQGNSPRSRWRSASLIMQN